MGLRCERCGESCTEDAEACPTCGNDDLVEADGPLDVTGQDAVWVCQQCGRRMPKRSPPCGRCGGMDIEAEEIDWEEELAEETSVGGYFDVGRRYVAIAVGLLIVFALIGVGLGGISVGDPTSTIEDAPGEGAVAGGHNLTAVETAVHERIDDERRNAGQEPLATDAELAAIAEYHNRDLVSQRYDEGIVAVEDVDGAYDEFDYDCPRPPTNVVLVVGYGDGATEPPIDRFETDAALADAIATALIDGAGTFTDHVAAGADVHVAPDGSIYVTYTAC